MTKEETLNFINESKWHTRRPGLERMGKLMELLGNPQKGPEFVHVAGTNGKGSTCAMLASVLQEAGYRVGLYTSPHLAQWNERIRFMGRSIPDEDFCEMAERVKDAALQMDDEPTVFEKITAMGFLYFAKVNAEIVVLEVGLGGRFDATNIIEKPLVSVITDLSLEHTEILGDTIGKIAGEKAGIIKPFSRVCSARQEAEAEEVINEAAAGALCSFKYVVPELLERRKIGLDGQVFDYKEREGVEIPFAAKYQCGNAALVLDVIDTLKALGKDIPEDAVRSGLRGVKWPGRFQILEKDPPFIVDGAHNPDGVTALRDCFEDLLPGQKGIFIMGVMADKDVDRMIEIIKPIADELICVKAIDYDRAMGAEDLLYKVKQQGIPAVSAVDMSDALAQGRAIRGSRPLCVFGSLYHLDRLIADVQ